MCRLTPMFSVPVIILPIAAKSLDINNINNIHNVVEFQRPLLEAPPPPPSIIFNAGALASIFQKLNTFLFKFEGSSTPH